MGRAKPEVKVGRAEVFHQVYRTSRPVKTGRAHIRRAVPGQEFRFLKRAGPSCRRAEPRPKKLISTMDARFKLSNFMRAKPLRALLVYIYILAGVPGVARGF